MAPVSEDLHDLVNKLEARVHELEQKLKQASGGSSANSTSDGVRMILMGPPGAGTYIHKALIFNALRVPYSVCSMTSARLIRYS